MKEDLDEAPLCIKILYVIRASLRAVAHARDALNMQEGKTAIQSSQFRLPLITICHNRTYLMQREEMGLGSKWGKVVVEAHHELLHGLTPAPQLAEAGVHTIEELITETVGTTKYVVSNACL